MAHFSEGALLLWHKPAIGIEAQWRELCGQSVQLRASRNLLAKQ